MQNNMEEGRIKQGRKMWKQTEKCGIRQKIVETVRKNVETGRKMWKKIKKLWKKI